MRNLLLFLAADLLFYAVLMTCLYALVVCL